MNTYDEQIRQYEHLVDVTLMKMFGGNQSFYNKIRLENSDLRQLGLIGLWQALKNHNPSRSDLQTHIINNIKWQVNRYIRHHGTLLPKKGSKKTVRNFTFEDIDKPVTESESLKLNEIIADPNVNVEGDIVDKFFTKSLLAELKESLSHYEYRVLIGKLKNENELITAGELGITRQYVNLLWKNLLKKLKRKYQYKKVI